MKAAVLAALLLTGCATFEAGPRRVAENTCSFLFLAAVPVAGPVLAGLCTFGVEEIPEEDDEEPQPRRRPMKRGH